MEETQEVTALCTCKTRYMPKVEETQVVCVL